MNMFQALHKQAEVADTDQSEKPSWMQRATDAVAPLGTKEFWQKPVTGDGTGWSRHLTPMNIGLAAGGAGLLAMLLRRSRRRRD